MFKASGSSSQHHILRLAIFVKSMLILWRIHWQTYYAPRLSMLCLKQILLARYVCCISVYVCTLHQLTHPRCHPLGVHWLIFTHHMQHCLATNPSLLSLIISFTMLLLCATTPRHWPSSPRYCIISHHAPRFLCWYLHFRLLVNFPGQSMDITRLPLLTSEKSSYVVMVARLLCVWLYRHSLWRRQSKIYVCMHFVQ